MKIQLLLLLLLSMGALQGALTPEEGLKRLKEGNQRFVEERLLHPDRTQERRLNLAKKGQSPYAVIVTCSDSRVVPEVIFDEGLGDLFVIRVAGNVIGPIELESIEFAVDALKPVIVVVMGHQECGAVDAVLKGKTKDISAIATLIEPSVKEAKRRKSTDPLRLSIELNALRMRKDLLKSTKIEKSAEARSLALYAAYYNLQTGAVEFLSSSLQNSG